MGIFLMNEISIEEQVLSFFRDELSIVMSDDWKEIPLELDTLLQDYAEGDEFPYAVEDYGKRFDVDVSDIHWRHYFPWENLPLLTRWFKTKRKEVEKTRKPLTVRMFAESAKAGRWIYD
ncbi:DUF1493 family protein [Pantoea sp. FN060301]|uniref:DUF1493 family protein n=1 Tax=Pantoea sp. FN060301 TaxID=3420380 RepID=UPI003D17F75B